MALVRVGSRVPARPFVAAPGGDVDTFGAGARAPGARGEAVALEMLASLCGASERAGAC
jgi:hypothetical protein